MMTPRYKAIEALKVMGNAAQKAFDPRIRVLLWNVFKCKRKGWNADFSMLIEDKDLILLQEAVTNSPFDSHFAASAKYQWIMARSFKNLRTNIETGVKTGSCVAAESQICSASNHCEPISKTKKMLLATVYPLSYSEQKLLVVNSHIINFVSFAKFKSHVDQVFETLSDHNGPILLAGDFNTWNNRRMNYFGQRAHMNKLEEVKMTRKAKLAHFYRHLDHIYCRGLSISDAKVHTNIHSSDHYPISLSLRFGVGEKLQ